MKAFFEPLKEYSELNEIREKIQKNRFPIQIVGCVDAGKCHLTQSLSKDKRVKLIITYNENRAKEIYEDYRLFDSNVLLYPSKDIIFYNADIHGNAIVKARMKVLEQLLSDKPVTVVASIDAGLDRILPLDYIAKHVVSIRATDTIDKTELQEKLIKLGYERQGQVEARGEFAMRGSIIDIFPITEDAPCRIELWDDEIDSMRIFDVTNQRSIENIDEISIFPASEFIFDEEAVKKGLEKIDRELQVSCDKLKKDLKVEEAARLRENINEFKENLEYSSSGINMESYVRFFSDETVSFFSYFNNENSLVFVDELLRITEKSEATYKEFSESMIGRLEKGYILPTQADVIFNYNELLAALADMRTIFISTLESKCPYVELGNSFDIVTHGLGAYNNSFDVLVKDLSKWKSNGYRIIIVSGVKSRAIRLAQDLNDKELPAFFSESNERTLMPGEIMVVSGSLKRGFEYPLIKFVIIAESDIFGTERKKKKAKSAYEGKAIHSFEDLRSGDYVVHESHGLGVYKGIEKIESDGATKDYIKIEYAAGGVLFIPATGLDVIQKYAGAQEKKPKLNKLNSVEWKNTKARVKGAVKELAGELVNLYALRQQEKGYDFGPDTVWQTEFEEMFPYTETDDQLRAIEETKHDMESTRIMDRLICGDVGYGKTEVALRAAFKAVHAGKQVAMLVPTTILAQQHYNTFTQRMRDFSVEIAQLSRFRTPAEQKKTLEGLQKGNIDIVIGTHRLLSKDVAFRNLGLLIIDEEQRFGVAHKEKIKQMKGDVDVLTLTATPIPRTLHMSMIGIRDMSILDEPPVDRLPIQTFVMEHDDEIIREAINRELARGGQVYYVYNRVNGIDELALRIGRLVPEAVVQFAHGQMSERTLEKIMYDFINGEIDVLVSTTIIETGMDISNVNTIIIDDAENLGLSQLYQLRGRVGRSSRTAYAFLMYRRNKMLKEIAEKRLSAIREFSELGSGYKIAMRDLEIRGAGNLLGAEQSGHMEAVGYDMYCKMLNEAVVSLKDGGVPAENFETTVDINIDAYIPSTYIRNEMQKLDVYKRIADIASQEEYYDMQEELTDRFGDMPMSVRYLLEVALIKAVAHEAEVEAVEHKGNEVRAVMYTKAHVYADKIPELVAKYNNRLKFTAAGTPAFNCRLLPSSDINSREKKKKTSTERLLEQILELVKDIKALKTLAIVVFMCIFMSGCGFAGVDLSGTGTPIVDEVQEKAELGEGVLMIVGDEEIPVSAVLPYIYIKKAEISELYGEEMWNYKVSKGGETIGDLYKEQILEEYIKMKIICGRKDSLQIKLDEDDYFEISESAAEFIEGLSKEEMSQTGITEKDVEKIFEDSLTALKVYEKISLEVDTDISDEEAKQVDLQYLFVEGYEIKDGEKEYYAGYKLTDYREEVAAIYEKLRNASSFLTTALANTDAEEAEGTFGKGDFPEEAEDIIFALKKGDISKIVETQEGSYVFYCVSPFNEAATNRKKEEIIAERVNKLFETEYEKWSSAITVKINDKLLEEIE